MSALKLKEILWEITPECDKGCSYCGSKDILKKKPLGDKDLLHIAKQLSDYGVEEITLTGGEPGTLAEKNPELFSKIIQILVDGGVKVKAVTYGKLIDVLPQEDYDKFDIFGISINLPKDIDYLNDLAYSKALEFSPADNTMITNFGKHNIWDFDKLSDCASSFACWQIQLTMGENVLSPEGIIYLRKKIKSLEMGNTTIVLADNLQVCHTCSAGLQSCSITYNGDVIACLSERSYEKKIKTYGSLLNKTIKDIWENEFKDIRFDGCRKCCRDYINFPEIDMNDLKTFPSEDFTPSDVIDDEYGPSIPMPAQLYGVINPSDTYVYGVTGPTNIQMYAVTNPKQPSHRWGGFGGSLKMVYGTFNPRKKDEENP